MERDFDGKSCCFELWFCTENFGIFPMSHFEWLQEISQISVKKNILLWFLHCCWRENRCQENSENSTFFKFWKKMRGGKGPSKAIKIAVFPFFLKLPIQMCNFLCKYLGAITVIAQLMLSAFLWPFHASKMRNRIFHDFLGSLPYLATSIFPSLKRFKMTSFAICILSTMQCLKINQKVAFKIASEASYVYILSWQKLIKNAKNC